MRIATDRLLLRQFEPGDVADFERVLRDPLTMAAWDGAIGPGAASEDVERYARAEIEHFASHMDRYGYAPLAVTERGVLMGDLGLQRLEDGEEVELIYRLASPAWGRGLGTEACDAVLAYAFGDLGVHRVVAVIAASNRRSQALARTLGFTPGREGTYYGRPLVRHTVDAEQHRAAARARAPRRAGG